MTAAERRHLSRVAALGCVVCYNNGYEDSVAEIHHIRTGITGAALRATNYRVIPLCPIHHRHGDGTLRFGNELGYHVSPEEWELRYGTQEDWLAEVLRMINVDAREAKYRQQEIAA